VTQYRFCTVGPQYRKQELYCPALGPVPLIVWQTIGGRVTARDVGSAKQNVPDKQQIAVVAGVMTNAVVLRERMVRTMRDRG
jgi:hypothetical protein